MGHEKRRAYCRGDRVGEWTVLYRDRRERPRGRTYGYRCRCSCGAEAFVPTQNLRTGTSTRCGACGRARAIETLRARRKPRLCRWCGRGEEAAFPAKRSTICTACEKKITRRGKWPCGKPRAVVVLHDVPREHVCEECEAWERAR